MYSSCCCYSCSCLRDLFKKASFYRFKSDRLEIWRDRSSSKYASINGVGFFDMTSYFHDGGSDVCPPIAGMHASASSGCPLARRARVTSYWLAVCATVPDPYNIYTCLKKISLSASGERTCSSSSSSFICPKYNSNNVYQ